MREEGYGPPPEREGGGDLPPHPKKNDKRNMAIAIVLRLFLNIVLEITLTKCRIQEEGF